MAFKFEFRNASGVICCRAHDVSTLCPNCREQATGQRFATKSIHALHNTLGRPPKQTLAERAAVVRE